jgi:hypothetical protein
MIFFGKTERVFGFENDPANPHEDKKMKIIKTY